MKSILLLALVLAVSSLVFGFIGRFVFGKKSSLNQSVSSAIGILFIYAITILIFSTGLDLKLFASPLPFVNVQDNTIFVSAFLGSDFLTICGELLNTIILAFVVNIITWLMPQGKKLLTWLLFRVLSVVLGMVAYALVGMLLSSVLPQGLLTWAPVILLGLLVLMLLVGALKFIVGAILITVNPLIGILYTFFFANVVGKMLSRAMLTTLLLAALIFGLNYIGLTVIAIGSATLLACIPILLLLLVLWFVVGKLL